MVITILSQDIEAGTKKFWSVSRAVVPKEHYERFSEGTLEVYKKWYASSVGKDLVNARNCITLRSYDLNANKDPESDEAKDFQKLLVDAGKVRKTFGYRDAFFFFKFFFWLY